MQSRFSRITTARPQLAHGRATRGRRQPARVYHALRPSAPDTTRRFLRPERSADRHHSPRRWFGYSSLPGPPRRLRGRGPRPDRSQDAAKPASDSLALPRHGTALHRTTDQPAQQALPPHPLNLPTRCTRTPHPNSRLLTARPQLADGRAMCQTRSGTSRRRARGAGPHARIRHVDRPPLVEWSNDA